VRLGPSSHVILGILAAAGPQTPYSLKQIIGRTIGYYWPFPHAQIYAETARLAELGLSVEEQEPTGLRRKRYAITPVGRAALESWLAAPTPDPAQFRDLGLLKLAFGSLSSPEARQTLRADQIASHEERLAAYERYAAMPLDPFLRATLELGLRYEQAALDFWRTVALDGESWPSS
jgi:DNA-binding PadR family transcriptional regulator